MIAILTGSPSSMLCAWSAANSPSPKLFPPRHNRKFHRAVLDEILQERVVSSRRRRNPRGVKRKMSSFPLRPPRAKPLPAIDISTTIRIIK